MDSRYNSSVSLCRVIGTGMIVLCHIGTAVGSAAIGQLFQAGVHLFLLISGFLHSRKEIDDPAGFMYRRLLRISVPCYIWIALMAVLGLLLGNAVSFVWMLLSALNLQGIHFMFTFLPMPEGIDGVVHLWFVTAVFLCYLLTIPVKRAEASGFSVKKWLGWGLVCTWLLGLIGIRLDYIWIYFAGYAAGKEQQCIRNRKYVLLSVIMVGAIALRLIVKGYCDVHGDNHIYLYVVIPAAYIALALWIFYTLDLINQKFRMMEWMNSNILGETIRKLDAISFYIYITHYAFVDAPLSVMGLTGNLAADLTVMVLLTFATSCGLKALEKKVIRCLPNA